MVACPKCDVFTFQCRVVKFISFAFTDYDVALSRLRDKTFNSLFWLFR